MVYGLVVKATVGPEAPDRCSQAFDAAISGASDGYDVSFWLAGEASWFALPGRAATCRIPGPVSLDAFLSNLIETSRVTLCKHCAARRGITPGAILPNIRMAGAAVFVEECLESIKAVVY